jgi:hypothetical protein
MKRILRSILTIAALATASLTFAQADPPSSGAVRIAMPPTSSVSNLLSSVTRSGETRFGWKWLAEQYDKDGNGTVIREEFPASEDKFVRLDRNWDGKLTQDDLSWSDGGVLGRQRETVFALSKAIDTTSDGRITPEEWLAVFTKSAKEKGYLTDEDLEQLIYLPRVRKSQKEQQSLVGWLERQGDNAKEFGKGPTLGELAPDFELRSPDGRTSVRLSSFRGNKPVVLIFGSFT